MRITKKWLKLAKASIQRELCTLAELRDPTKIADEFAKAFPHNTTTRETVQKLKWLIVRVLDINLPDHCLD